MLYNTDNIRKYFGQKVWAKLKEQSTGQQFLIVIESLCINDDYPDAIITNFIPYLPDFRYRYNRFFTSLKTNGRTILPSNWCIRMFPEVYDWITKSLNIRNVTYNPHNYWWNENKQSWNWRPDDIVELSRFEFHRLILKKELTEYDIKFLDNEYSLSNNSKDTIIDSYSYSLSYGYHYLNSRR